MVIGNNEKGEVCAINNKAQNYRTSSFWRLWNAHYAIMNDSSTLVLGYRDLPKRKGVYSKTSVETILPLSRIVKFSRFPKQDNIGTLLRYVTSCYM